MSSTVFSRLRSVFPKTLNPKTSVKPSPAVKTFVKTSPSVINFVKPSPDVKTSISISSTASQIDSIVEKFKKSSDSGNFRGRFSHYEATVRRLTNAQQFSAIKDILEHQKQYPEIKDERFVVRLIGLYGKAKLLDEAQKLFDEMPSLNCERTVVSFNALLAACVSAKDYDKIGKLFKELPEKLSIQPDIVSYNTVIKALCDAGSLDSAFLMMEELEINNMKPDLVTFNTLLDALYSAKKFSEAEKLWCSMEEKNVVANVRSYNSRLRGFVRDDRIAEAVLLIKEMEKKEVKPDSFSYNALIKGFVDSGNLEEAKKWCNVMAENGCTPDWATFGMLVPLACDNKDFDYAFQLCKESIKKNRKVPDSIMKKVIDGLTERKEDEKARKLKNMAKI